MRAGDLDTRIEIQANTRVRDGMGSSTLTWATVDKVWAKLVDVKGSEQAESAQRQAHVTHWVTIRRYPTLTTAHRLKYGSRTFNIKFLNDGRRDGYMLLDCEEIVGKAAS